MSVVKHNIFTHISGIISTILLLAFLEEIKVLFLIRKGCIIIRLVEGRNVTIKNAQSLENCSRKGRQTIRAVAKKLKLFLFVNLLV